MLLIEINGLSKQTKLPVNCFTYPIWKTKLAANLDSATKSQRSTNLAQKKIIDDIEFTNDERGEIDFLTGSPKRSAIFKAVEKIVIQAAYTKFEQEFKKLKIVAPLWRYGSNISTRLIWSSILLKPSGQETGISTSTPFRKCCHTSRNTYPYTNTYTHANGTSSITLTIKETYFYFHHYETKYECSRLSKTVNIIPTFQYQNISKIPFSQDKFVSNEWYFYFQEYEKKWIFTS